jgi:preprotein translocase subunit Sec61beta
MLSFMREDQMNKKEIESPTLTGNFLVWIGLFLVLLVAVAHFVLKFF